jgi:hypothetical protein
MQHNEKMKLTTIINKFDSDGNLNKHWANQQAKPPQSYFFHWHWKQPTAPADNIPYTSVHKNWFTPGGNRNG